MQWVNRWLWILLLGGLLSACALASTHAAPIHREEQIAVPGGRLFALVRGENPKAPILVWLHGDRVEQSDLCSGSTTQRSNDVSWWSISISAGRGDLSMQRPTLAP
uniref:Uncharacterized protein n=1 Tax=Phenylobacterium glaciei TaxID=2803784 RepID=A0A974P7Y9_9CAUL|nr:hypothetical protein JKL49_22655 [Phenylobacterium glaciei]